MNFVQCYFISSQKFGGSLIIYSYLFSNKFILNKQSQFTHLERYVYVSNEVLFVK